MGTSLYAAGQALNGEAWGLHDARTNGVRIDYVARRLELELDLAVDERQCDWRPARFVVTGLVHCVMEAPYARDYGPPYWNVAGERIDVREVESATPGPDARRPPKPPTAWVCSLYDSGLNTFFSIAGEDCVGEWTGSAQSGEPDLCFPGETIDVPEED